MELFVFASHPRFTAFLLTSMFATLTACGGGGGSDSPPPPDTTPATVSYDSEPGIREDIVITFNEPVDPDTLEIEGLLVDLAADPEWNNANTQVTLSPNGLPGDPAAWESGVQTITGTVEDMAGNTTQLDIGFEIRLMFENFQAASVVIGQEDFDMGEANHDGTPAADTLANPLGRAQVFNNRFWVPDTFNNRALGFDGTPESDGEDAFWVLGQSGFTSNNEGTSATALATPTAILEHQEQYYIVDASNNRILIYDELHIAPPAVEASNVIGQSNPDTQSPECTASGLRTPTDIQIVDDKLIVADYGNNRILIWNSVPTGNGDEPADLVLGQQAMDVCTQNDRNGDESSDLPSAQTLSLPFSIWSDGERLVVADNDNNRVLIWNTFPAASSQHADVVLGQESFTVGDVNAGQADPNGNTLALSQSEVEGPVSGVYSNGIQLFVADSGNNRILIWNSFPTENSPADRVIGQELFTEGGLREVSGKSLHPSGVSLYRDKMIVTDAEYSRVLVFDAQ